MNKTEARKLAPGVYHLFFKDGRVALAVVGKCAQNRDRWFVDIDSVGFSSTNWRGIEKAIMAGVKPVVLQTAKPVVTSILTAGKKPTRAPRKAPAKKAPAKKAPAKKRGRPKGSKNKPKLAA